jgi:hypothetical protein
MRPLEESNHEMPRRRAGFPKRLLRAEPVARFAAARAFLCYPVPREPAKYRVLIFSQSTCTLKRSQTREKEGIKIH